MEPLNGIAPAPVTFDVTTTPSAPGDSAGAPVRLTFDVVQSQLAYQIRLEGVAAGTARAQLVPASP